MIDDVLRPAPLGWDAPFGGLARAAAEGKRRRRRRVVRSSACGATVVVLVVAAAMLREPHDWDVRMQPVAPPGGLGRPAPARQPAPTEGTPTPRVVRSGELPGVEGPSAAAGRSVAAPEPPPSQGRDVRSPAPTKPPADPVVRWSDEARDGECQKLGDAWCLTVTTVGAPGETKLALRACRSQFETDGTVEFPGRNEVDFTVARDGRELWRWSRGFPDGGAAHTLDVGALTCVVWTTRWWGVVDDEEARASTGRYVVTAWSTAWPNRTVTAEFSHDA